MVVNLEQEFIQSLILDKVTPEEERYLFCKSKSLDFSVLNRPTYNWVLDFYETHKQFPQPGIFKNKWTAFFWLDQELSSFSYYKVAMVEATDAAHTSNMIMKAGQILNTEGAQAVWNYVQHENAALLATSQGGVDESVQDVLDDDLTQYLLDKADGKHSGLRTGNTEIDRYTYGVLPHQLWAYFARPGNYKTMLSIEIAKQFTYMQEDVKVWNEGSVLLISPEMSTGEIRERLYCNVGGLRLDDYIMGSLIEPDLAAIREGVAQLKRKLIIRTDIFDYQALYQICCRIKPVAVIIDGVYLLARSKKHDDQSELLKNLKQMQSQDTSPIKGIPIVIFSQLNRNLEVGFADSYEQDSNVAIYFERLPAKASQQKGDKEILTNQLEFSSKKVRRGKEFYKIPVWFDESKSRFVNGDMPQEFLVEENKKKVEQGEAPVQKVNRSVLPPDSLF